MSIVFDLSHARVTVSRVSDGVEIEVWPKTGVSSYAVVGRATAREIADAIHVAAEEASERPDNVVDMVARRRDGA